MTINNQTIDLDARQILLKRGNLAVNNSYIGPIGEITLDTTNFTLRVHNGVTPGGVMVPTEPTTRTWITSYLEGNLAPIVAATVANTTSTITDLISNVSANVTALAANVEATFSQLVGNASSQLNTLEEIAISLDNDPALASNLRILITAVQSNLNTEVARAFAAETILQTNINNEANARISADASLQSNISAEAGIRSAADASLQSQINNILSNFDANILDSFTEVASTVSSLNSNISAEANARIAADNSLQSNLNSEASTRSSEDSALQANITAEVSRATSAESALQANITAEVNARTQAVSDESNARISADTSLQSNITAETNARIQAVSDEANARIASDTSLQSNITAETNARIQAVSDEANARIASDTTLQSNITAEETARIQAVSDEANARIAADTSLQSNITAETNARIQAVSDEANARIASDTTLQSNITAEETARIQAVSNEANTRASADTSLQSNITALDNSLATVAKSGSYPDLINRPNFSAFDSNIIPATDVTYYLGNATNRWHSLYVGPGSISVGNITISESANGKMSVTTPIDLSNSDIQWANILSKPNFAAIATSGAYSDLSGVPTNLNQFTNGPDFANVTYVNTLVTNEANARGTATANLQNQIDNILNNADPAALDSLSEIVTAFQNADSNLLAALNNLSSSAGSNLTAEINRATSAEANLQANISSEISARIQAVSDEANARVAADTSLQSNITAEVNARVQAVSDEANARIAADTSLQSNITAEVNARIQSISDEANARVASDEALQSNITAEVNARIQAVSDEANARITSDETLQSNITAEVNARVQAISDEANARIASDEGLQSNITAEVNARVQAISDEANARISSDESLQSNITAEVNARVQAISDEANARISSDESLQSNITAEVNARIQAVSDEANARVSADSGLQSNITAEVNARIQAVSDEANARISADQTLQSNIDSLANVAFTGLLDRLSNANSSVQLTTSGNVVFTSENTSWMFDLNGNLETPGRVTADSILVSTGIQGTDSSPAPSISGFQSISVFGNISGSNLLLTGDINNDRSQIKFVANSSGDGAGYTTIELRPDTTASQEQYLVIDPTAPNHIHIRAGGTQDNSQAALFLGGENSYFQVASGSNPPVYVVSNNNVWTFNVDGNFSLPGNVILNTPTNLQFLDPSAGPITVGALSSVGNISFSDNTYQTTAWTGSAPTVDVTNTNGLSTTYYPTFVESRTNGQYVRADVDLTYRTDNNLLKSGNLQVGQNIYGSYLGGISNAIQFRPNIDIDKRFLFTVDSIGGTYLRSGMEMPMAEVNKASTLGFPHNNGHSGYIYSQGSDANGTEFNNAFNIMSNGVDLKLSAFNSDDKYVWTFDVKGNLTLPQTDMNVSPAPVSLPGITYTDGTRQTTAWTGGVDRIKNGSAEVVVANTGVISLPAVSNSQVTISGATKTVKGNPYSVRSAYSNEFEIWKASSEDVVAAKVTVRLHNDYYTYTELFDVMLVKEATNNANVSFSVGPRLKSDDSYPDGIVDVRLSDGNKLTMYYTSVKGDASFYTFDAVEFTKTV